MNLPITASFVRTGETYGRSAVATKPLIEFSMAGRPVSCYDVGTFLMHNGGLQLEGKSSELALIKAEVESFQNWLEDQIYEGE